MALPPVQFFGVVGSMKLGWSILWSFPGRASIGTLIAFMNLEVLGSQPMDEKPKESERSSFSRHLIFGQPVSGVTIGVMETLDRWGYITAGVSFLALGMVVFVHAWYIFAVTVGSKVLPAVLGLVHDLLLVIILLELFRTIINFLKTKIITLEPFLYICIIASTRRILTTGAQIDTLEDLTDQYFHRYLLDVGANVLVIVALVIALYMVRKAPQRSIA
jgi:uncharacterized membrane protein (DUF373 family)